MSETLYRRYRPQSFKEVMGQEKVIHSLRQVIKDRSSQAFLFTGPSGVGKTTLARITARELGAVDHSILEIDAATYTGIDAMRSVTESMNFKPFGDVRTRALIVDECARLSKQAWDSLLKSIEEPPEHIVWLFCTTEPNKVPTTIKTRCTTYSLALLNDESIHELVEDVCNGENIELADGVSDIIVHQAKGSPRQALVNLALTMGCKDRNSASTLLQHVAESDPIIELCRFLVKGGSFVKAMSILSKVSDQPPEGVRIVVANYMASALKSANTDKQAIYLLNLLDAFSTSYQQTDGAAPLLLSIGKCLFQMETG